MSLIDDFFAKAGNAKLAKLEIQAHEMEEDGVLNTKGTGGDSNGKVFQAYYNPTTFSSEYAIEYDNDMAYGDLKVSARFKKYTATTYSFSLLLDGTQASIPQGLSSTGADPTSKGFVKAKVDEFKAVAYSYEGEHHRPQYLSLKWGTTAVDRCVLTGFSLNYDLFDAEGNPLRATIACKFQEYSYRELTEAEKNPKSPDMTHIRVVQQGDRLPLMCERIYGDAKLYLEVARYNKISNYRNLTPGQKIYFPPLLTTES